MVKIEPGKIYKFGFETMIIDNCYFSVLTSRHEGWLVCIGWIPNVKPSGMLRINQHPAFRADRSLVIGKVKRIDDMMKKPFTKAIILCNNDNLEFV